MEPVRHTCGARLLDSLYPVQALDGPSPDIAVKCPRCSREQRGNVIARYRLKLPRWIGPVSPQPVYCQNLQCLTRLCDLSLPYMLVENFGDIQIKCHKCGELNCIELSGLARIE